MFTNPIYLIYMYKEDLALNNQQGLICHQTKPNPGHYIVEFVPLACVNFITPQIVCSWFYGESQLCCEVIYTLWEVPLVV